MLSFAASELLKAVRLEEGGQVRNVAAAWAAEQSTAAWWVFESGRPFGGAFAATSGSKCWPARI